MTALRQEWPGAREVEARLQDPLPGRADDAGSVRALAYTEVVGTPEIGDEVLLNVSALARGLGTGGFALVVAIPERLPADPAPGPGHLVKDRYTPLQTMVLGVDDQESEHHDVLAAPADLGGMPVVVADLHSAVPAIVAGVRSERTDLRIAYVLTDGAALPLQFSRAIAGLRDAGWIHGTVSTGQAYGGDHEAVTVHSGLLAARAVIGADVTVVAQGPGNLGTGTPWGFSGVVVGEHLNAAAVLGGTPVAAVRVSSADARGRHAGVSHHTLTTLSKVARPGADVPLPLWRDVEGFELDDIGARVRQQASPLAASHSIVDVPAGKLVPTLRTSPVRLSTMGRGLDEDPASFIAAAAAGAHAARLVGA